METPTQLTPVSPWKRRKVVVTETVELPELGVVVTLRNLDTLLTSGARGEIAALTEEYLGGADDDDPTPYSAEDGEEYFLNAELIEDLCLLRQMQVAEKRFSIDWWLGVALCCPEEYGLLNQVAARLNKAAQRRDPGNSPAATGPASS